MEAPNVYTTLNLAYERKRISSYCFTAGSTSAFTGYVKPEYSLKEFWFAVNLITIDLFDPTGLSLGIKLFIVNPIYHRFPKVILSLPTIISLKTAPSQPCLDPAAVFQELVLLCGVLLLQDKIFFIKF